MEEDHLKVIYRIDGKLDMLLDQHVNHATRISALETARDKAIGYVIALGAVFAAVWHLIPKAIASITGAH